MANMAFCPQILKLCCSMFGLLLKAPSTFISGTNQKKKHVSCETSNLQGFGQYCFCDLVFTLNKMMIIRHEGVS